MKLHRTHVVWRLGFVSPSSGVVHQDHEAHIVASMDTDMQKLFIGAR